MDPVPPIGQTPQPTDAPPPSGPLGLQRRKAQVMRKVVTRKKQFQASQTPLSAPGTGQPNGGS